MNSYFYSFGALALALMVSGLPALAFANESTSTLEASRDNMQIRSNVQFENSPTSVRSFEEMEARIEWNRQELDRDDASTTPEDRDTVKNTNPVRLAVRTFLDSKDLLGGIGEQVSKIAKEMNDSVATTTDIEIKIHSRGFFARLFFGGDRGAAKSISQEVARNQERIERLITLLARANLSVEMRTALNAQVTVLEDSQSRLKDLAEREQNSWGLFSWRFGSK